MKRWVGVGGLIGEDVYNWMGCAFLAFMLVYNMGFTVLATGWGGKAVGWG